MKKYLGGSIALIIAVSAAAFTAPKHFGNQSWMYNGGSVTSENSYTSGNPGCSGNVTICKIIAPADAANPGHPKIDPDLANRITTQDVTKGDVFLKN